MPLTGLGEKEVILHKMHGTIEEPETIIVTQSDYIRYLTTLNDRDRGMPEYFRRQVLPQVTLLFLGYSLEDWNFRVIWEGLVSSSAPQTMQRSYALTKNPDHFQITYWAPRNIVVLDQDITEFAERLALKFNLDVPQLGIERRQNGAHQQEAEDETS